MKSLLEDTLDGPSLADIQGQLERRIWGNAMLLMIVFTPLSLLRSLNTGWLPIYTVHCILLVPMVTMQLFARRISYRWRVVAALAYFQIAGTLGLFLMGFLGFGCLWLATTSYLVAIVFGHRAGLAGIAGNLLLVSIAAYGFRNGLLDLPVRAAWYMQSVYTWLLGFFMMALFPWTLLNSAGAYKEAVVNLLRRVDSQRSQIEHLASHDHLTGLVQLRVIQERMPVALHQARRSGHKVAVLFLDLDGFKAVNDNQGHAAGDHVLRSVGNVLRSVVRESDTVSRAGGDEFMILLENLVDADIAVSIARRIQSDLSRPIPYQNAMLSIGASIGVALFPEHGADARSLQQAADSAMYKVKKKGKGGYIFSGESTVRRDAEAVELSETCKVRQLYYG